MQYLKEFSVNDFNFHSGAKDVIEIIKAQDRIDEFESYIDEMFDGQTPTSCEINDFVWFNKEEIFEYLKIKAY